MSKIGAMEGVSPCTQVCCIRIALQSLWANKPRSAFTLLGVVIGVSAVIAVVTFVNGINGYVAERVFRLGTDVFIVFKVSPAVTNVDHFLEGEKLKDLTLDDYQEVLETCKHCLYVRASLRNLSGPVKYGEQSASVMFMVRSQVSGVRSQVSRLRSRYRSQVTGFVKMLDHFHSGWLWHTLSFQCSRGTAVGFGWSFSPHLESAGRR
jgi:MacB-like periplasmic core domain